MQIYGIRYKVPKDEGNVDVMNLLKKILEGARWMQKSLIL